MKYGAIVILIFALTSCSGIPDVVRGVLQETRYPPPQNAPYQPQALRRPPSITYHTYQLPGRYPVQCATYGTITTCY